MAAEERVEDIAAQEGVVQALGARTLPARLVVPFLGLLGAVTA